MLRYEQTEANVILLETEGMEEGRLRFRQCRYVSYKESLVFQEEMAFSRL